MPTAIKEWKPDADTDELIRMYAEQTGNAYHVCAAFVVLDREPPSGGGFSGPESDIIQAHYKTYDPNGSQRAFEAEKAETAGL